MGSYVCNLEGVTCDQLRDMWQNRWCTEDKCRRREELGGRRCGVILRVWGRHFAMFLGGLSYVHMTDREVRLGYFYKSLNRLQDYIDLLSCTGLSADARRRAKRAREVIVDDYIAFVGVTRA